MKKIVLAAIFLLVAARANAILIDFEIGPRCILPPNVPNPCAPDLFGSTQPLTTRYSSLGVTFSGPAPGQGGAILWSGTFGVPAHSGEGILAFNTNLVSGAYAFFPETLTFSRLVSHVEIWAASGNNCFSPDCANDVIQTFVMDAFNDANSLIASNTISTRFFAPLSVDAPDIRSVRIIRTSGTGGSELDDLSFTLAAVPEPAAVWLLLAGSIALVFRRNFSRQ